MNPNIEIIMPELWAVNSYWVKTGCIKELSPIPGIDYDVNEHASLTDDGIMVLKKDSELYPILKQFVPKIMQHTDEELQYYYKPIHSKVVLDDYERLYLNVMEWEIKRRCVKQEYLMNHPKPTLKDKIKEFFRKVGEKFGYYQNSD